MFFYNPFWNSNTMFRSDYPLSYLNSGRIPTIERASATQVFVNYYVDLLITECQSKRDMSVAVE